MNTYQGYTESQERIDARLARINAVAELERIAEQAVKEERTDPATLPQAIEQVRIFSATSKMYSEKIKELTERLDTPEPTLREKFMDSPSRYIVGLGAISAVVTFLVWVILS